MNARVMWMGLFVAAVCLCLGGVAVAQEPGDPPPDDPLGDLTDAVEQLTAAVEQLRSESVPRSEFDELKSRVDTLQNKVDDVANDLDGKLQVAFEESKLNRQILNGVARADGNGGYMLDLQGNMQRPQFRQDLSSAVHQSMRTEGTLRIQNNMGATYSVLVNNRRYVQVAPYSTLDVRVPVGTVTTQLVGHEGVKSWTITAPNYRQDVVVNPRPVTPIYVEPLYVDPWVAGPFFSYP